MIFSHNFKVLTHFSKNFFRFYSIPKVKILPSALALNHFDQFYSPVFKNWASIRLGLLCPHYYCAVVNVFSKKIIAAENFHGMEVFNLRDKYLLNLAESANDTTATVNDTPDRFESTSICEVHKDCENICDKYVDTNKISDYESDTTDNSITSTISQEEYMPATKFKNSYSELEEDYSDYYEINMDYKAQLVPYGTIHYPEHWNIFYCQRGKFKRFPPPDTDASGLLNYYLMDGASVLPILALDIKKGEDVGDLCASPGGKTLSILFGMQFGKLVCNDISIARINKLKSVLNLYLPGTEEWSKKILVSNLDVADWNFLESFDKILLDVPCTNDRLSVSRDNNNIFQPKRFNERMQIPKLQTTMLCSALKALKPGGSLVYSTCSLSPIQNDGVVHMALSKLSSESNLEFIVNDLNESFKPLRNMFQFSDNCKYGQLIVPFLPLNYGPMYIAKIKRNK